MVSSSIHQDIAILDPFNVGVTCCLRYFPNSIERFVTGRRISGGKIYVEIFRKLWGLSRVFVHIELVLARYISAWHRASRILLIDHCCAAMNIFMELTWPWREVTMSGVPPDGFSRWMEALAAIMSTSPPAWGKQGIDISMNASIITFIREWSGLFW